MRKNKVENFSVGGSLMFFIPLYLTFLFAFYLNLVNLFIHENVILHCLFHSLISSISHAPDEHYPYKKCRVCCKRYHKPQSVSE